MRHGSAGAAVDVVGVVAAGRARSGAARSAGTVVTMRPDAQAGPHQRDEVGPQRLPARRVEEAAGQVRVDAVAVEDLGPVDVADARRAPPGPSAGRRSAPGCGRCGRTPGSPSGRGRSGSGPSRARMASTSDGLEHLARRRAAEVGPARRRRPSACGPRRRGGGGSPVARRRTLPNSPRWTCTMRSPNAAKRCLPWARHVVEHAPVDERGVGEAALRARHVRSTRPANWARCDARQAVQRVTLGHRSHARPRCRRGRGGRRRRRTCRSARRRWRGRGRSRSRTAARRRRAWPRAASPVAPRRRGVALDDDRRRPAARPRVEARRRARAAPSAARRRRRRALAAGEQPGGELEQDLRLGVAAHRAEHGGQLAVAGRHRRAQRVRRPPAGRAARPGGPARRLKPRPRLWRLIPVVGSTSHDPKPEALDWIRLTAIPAASAVHRYVVSPGAGGDRPAAGALEVDEAGARRRSRRAGRRRRPRRGARRAGRTPAVAAASTSRWAQRGVVGVVGQAERVGEPGGAEQQVALRVRADRRQLDAERRAPQRRRPSRPATAARSASVKSPSPSASRPSPNAPP